MNDDVNGKLYFVNQNVFRVSIVLFDYENICSIHSNIVHCPLRKWLQTNGLRIEFSSTLYAYVTHNHHEWTIRYFDFETKMVISRSHRFAMVSSPSGGADIRNAKLVTETRRKTMPSVDK